MSTFEITARPKMIFGLLLLAAFTIVLPGTAANVITHQVIGNENHNIAKLMNRFDLANEPSLIQWYSTTTMLACSALLWTIATYKQHSGGKYTMHWFGLAVIFLLFSIDEAIMLHEMLDKPFRQLLGAGGILYITWVVPGAAFVLVVGITYFQFLLHLDRRSRRLFIAAGTIFITGALLMELPGGVLYEKYGFSTYHYITSYVVEELMETIGIALFIYTLLDYIDSNIGPIRFRVRRTGVAS